jgi:hypothetical protein
MSTFTADGELGDQGDAELVGRFVEEASGLVVYQLLALAATTIRWASLKTGRSETEILDELAENYVA